MDTSTWFLNFEHEEAIAWAEAHDLIPELMAPLVVEENGRYLIKRFRFSDHFGGSQPYWVPKAADLPAWDPKNPSGAIRPSQPKRPGPPLPTKRPAPALPAPDDIPLLLRGS